MNFEKRISQLLSILFIVKVSKRNKIKLQLVSLVLKRKEQICASI